MTIYLSNRDGNGKTSEEGHYKLQTSVFSGNVLGSDSLKVKQNSPLGRSVLVSSGQYKIDTLNDYSYTGWNTSDAVVNISTADPANPRITVIVAYVDKDEVTSPSPPNNPGITKLIAVDGTAGAVPVVPDNTVVQAQVGAGNPYIILANITVGTNATQIVNADIVDVRQLISLESNLVGSNSLIDNSVTSSKLNDLSVTSAKLAANSVTTAKVLDGAITDDKWRNGIAFFARRTSGRPIASSTFTLMAADNIICNFGNAYSNVSNAGRFTAPVEGLYSFYAKLNASRASNNRAIIELRINGVNTYARASDITGTIIGLVTANSLVQMNPGDYCECVVWTAVATDIASTGSGSSEFGGFLVTRT